MGKGASTSKTNVTKRLPDYSSEQSAQANGTGTGAGGAGGPDGETTNACLITFREKLQFDTSAADLVKVGFQFTLVPNSSGDLELIANGRVVGQYAGAQLALLKQCISGGYIYRGTVRVVEQDGVDCEITGFGVSDGTTSTM